MRNQIVIAGSGIALLATLAVSGHKLYANNPSSEQSQHKFSDVFLAIKPGDEVTFANQDGVLHNLVSSSPDYTVEIGELQPGTSKTLVFNHKGVLDLVCSKHPEMQMTIYVRKPAGENEANADT
ncbi:MAG: hypothetical protein HY273_12510, partial [Gammaproteobacteria bacterium]|nr:hypothetical protein [Gammaproteobacteria bacterium]